MIGSGTIEDPFLIRGDVDLQNYMFPQDDLNLLAGTYTGNIRIFMLDGSELYNHTISPFQKNTVIFDGSLSIETPRNILKGLHLTNSNFANRNTEQEGSNPSDIDVSFRLKFDDANNAVIESILHDSATLFASYHNNVEISDSIFFYGGWHGPDRGHGHGIYVSGDTIKIKNCIIFDVFGYGVQAYGSGETVKVDNVTVENCIIFGAGSLEGSPQSNILIGGDTGCFVSLPTVKNCCTYHRGNEGEGILIGLLGTHGGAIQNNIVVGGATSLEFRGWQDDQKVVIGNWFGAPVLGVDPDIFTDNIYSSGVPDIVKVYASEYTSTLAHVAIFNGSSADNVVVDLSIITGLSVGDGVTVANVQDLFVDIVIAALDANKCISIDMRAISHTVATPQGLTAPESTFPFFGVFVIRKQ